MWYFPFPMDLACVMFERFAFHGLVYAVVKIQGAYSINGVDGSFGQDKQREIQGFVEKSMEDGLL